LKYSPEESAILIFSLSADLRHTRLKKLADTLDINAVARGALNALVDVYEYSGLVRYYGIHAILVDYPSNGRLFDLRSKHRTLTIAQVFEIEELTNYASHCAMSLRYALGPKAGPVERHPLPDKPAIPDFLNRPIPTGIRVGQPLAPRPQP